MLRMLERFKILLTGQFAVHYNMYVCGFLFHFCFFILRTRSTTIWLQLAENNICQPKINFLAVAILLSTAIYPQRLFCRELFLIGQS